MSAYAVQFNGRYYDPVADCTRFVASTLSWIPAQLGNAGQWLSSARAQGLQTGSTPMVGSVAVFGPGQSQASSAGHVAVVTGVNSPSSFTVAESDFTGSNTVDSRTVNGTVGNGALLGFIYAPANQLNASVKAAQGVAGAPSSTTSSSTSSGASSSSNSGCQSLGEIFSSPVQGVPVVGGLWAAASSPVKLVQWGTQPCVLWRAGVIFGVLVVGGLGLYLMFRQEVDTAAGKVARVAA